jgi:hypothetical protein
MQATQYALGRAGVVVLHKGDWLANSLFKLGLVKTLIEKAAIVPEQFGLEQDDVGDS